QRFVIHPSLEINDYAIGRTANPIIPKFVGYSFVASLPPLLNLASVLLYYWIDDLLVAFRLLQKRVFFGALVPFQLGNAQFVLLTYKDRIIHRGTVLPPVTATRSNKIRPRIIALVVFQRI